MDKPAANLQPAFYAWRIHELQAIAKACGYAVALHGSMTKDLDVIAVPWTKRALRPQTLVKRLCESMDLSFDETRNPTTMPHGRCAWSLHFDHGCGYIDLSVTPRVTDRHTEEK